MEIPQAIIRRAILSATASARARGRDARPADIARMLQQKYDPQKLHEFAQWERVARSAVEMVAVARSVMDLLPMPVAGGVDNAIR